MMSAKTVLPNFNLDNYNKNHNYSNNNNNNTLIAKDHLGEYLESWEGQQPVQKPSSESIDSQLKIQKSNR